MPKKIMVTRPRLSGIDQKIHRNRFYVGAASALDRNWGHTTLPAALKHAENVLMEDDREFVFVVQIVRIVKRKRLPAEIIKV